MAETIFTAIEYRTNEYDFCPGGVYQFTWEGQTYLCDHIANGPDGLEASFTLDIAPADSNFFAWTGAARTFCVGVTLATGRFARAQAFGARLAKGQGATACLS